MSESDTPAAVPAPALESRPRRMPRTSFATILAVVVAVLAIAGWYDARRDVNRVRDEVSKRLAAADQEARESRIVAKKAEEDAREAVGKLAILDARIGESKSQQIALEQLYQELSRGSDEWMLAEIEQTLSIASQQLQLAGNVQAALFALQTADARLARVNRPQYIRLRDAILEDVKTLKALPSLDIPGLTLRLDQVISGVESMTLLADGRPQPEPEPLADATTVWSRVGALVWGEVRQLVRVQRLDSADQALLTAEAGSFLRENLKLRLLSARVALLQRNDAVFKSDVKLARAALVKYFDGRQKEVAGAVAMLDEFERARVSVELPSLAGSLAAVRTAKVAGEKPR